MANLETSTDRARQFFEDKLSFTLGPGELDAARKAESVRIVDVRTKDDFDAAHIPGSVNLPRTQWGDGESALGRDRPNVFLCYTEHCPLSAQAAAAFAAKGYPVKELTGGFEAWKEYGLPTESARTEHEEPVARTRAFLAEKRATETGESKEKAPPPAPNAKGEEKRPEKPAKEPPKNDKRALSEPRRNDEPDGAEANGSAEANESTDAKGVTAVTDDASGKARGGVEKEREAPPVRREEGFVSTKLEGDRSDGTQTDSAVVKEVPSNDGQNPSRPAESADADATTRDPANRRDDPEADEEAEPASGRRPRPTSAIPEEPTSQRVVK